MMINRRLLFGILGGAAAGAAIPAVAKPAIEIPDDYHIDFELLTEWGNLYYEVEDQNKDGFELEINVNDINGVPLEPYRNAIRWWITRHYEGGEGNALLSGVAQSEVYECEYRGWRNRIRVDFRKLAP
jgi:hypothetical protein